MYDLTRFTLSDMTRCGIELRKLGAGAGSMEEVAGRVVGTLYRGLRAPAGVAGAAGAAGAAEGADVPACALVRMFVTMPYGALEPALQRFARSLLGEEAPSPALKCLTLLATAGELPEWNSRRSSAGHQALPLPSRESVLRSPMIAQLIRQLGVDVGTLLSPAPGLVVDTAQHTFNVFHVAEAVGSPHIPAQQEFVIPHRVRSVLGFGGQLPTGDLFAVILFSRAPIPREVADLFKTLALNVKVAILPFAGARVFA